MGAAFRAELFKLRKRPAIWVLGSIVPLLLPFFGYFVSYTEAKSGPIVADPTRIESLLPAELVRNVIGIVPVLGAALGVVLGALVASSEYALGTLKTILTQAPPRLAVYAGQLLAVWAMLGVIVVALFGASGAASVVIALLEHRLGAWPSAPQLAGGIGAAWLTFAVSASFGLLLAHLFRSPGLSIGLALVWLSAVEVLVGTVADQVKPLVPVSHTLLMANIGSIGALFEPPGSQIIFPVGGVHALWVLIAYLVGFPTVGAILVRIRDVR
jgi:ABC-2 type transport system permease protein